MVNFLEWENQDICYHNWSKIWTHDFYPAKSCSLCGEYHLESDPQVLERLLKKFTLDLKKYFSFYQASVIPSDKARYFKSIQDTNLKIYGIQQLLNTSKLEGKLEGTTSNTNTLEGNNNNTTKLEGITNNTNSLEGTSNNTSKLEGISNGWEEIQKGRYRYWRWRENGIKKAKYLGKV